MERLKQREVLGSDDVLIKAAKALFIRVIIESVHKVAARPPVNRMDRG